MSNKQDRSFLNLEFASNVLVGVFAAAAVAVLFLWISLNPADTYVMSVPGMDGQPPASAIVEEIVDIGAFFEAGGGTASTITASWTRFRGDRGDNINNEDTKLLNRFGPEDPKILWTVSLGEGYAGAAVKNGRVYVLDYDEAERADMLRCISLDDGVEIWRRWYHVSVKKNYGQSRTVPAVTDEFVLTLGPQGHLMCVEADTGDLLWGKDLHKEFDMEIPDWYVGQCPLIDGTEAVLGIGGSSLMVGIECSTGEIKWQVPNPSGYKMSHSSVMLMEDVLGKRMYVYAAKGVVAGISAEVKDRGALLWQYAPFDAKAITPSPIHVGGGRIFITAGYGIGGILLRLSQIENEFGVSVDYHLGPLEGFSSFQQTPLFFEGHIYGILPKDAGKLQGQFACFDPDGELVWTSGETNRFGFGPYIIADGKFLILNDDGVLTVARASAFRYEELGRIKILDGLQRNAWAPMAIVDGLLIARDFKTMVCVDLRAERRN